MATSAHPTLPGQIHLDDDDPQQDQHILDSVRSKSNSNSNSPTRTPLPSSRNGSPQRHPVPTSHYAFSPSSDGSISSPDVTHDHAASRLLQPKVTITTNAPPSSPPPLHPIDRLPSLLLPTSLASATEERTARPTLTTTLEPKKTADSRDRDRKTGRSKKETSTGRTKKETSTGRGSERSARVSPTATTSAKPTTPPVLNEQAAEPAAAVSECESDSAAPSEFPRKRPSSRKKKSASKAAMELSVAVIDEAEVAPSNISSTLTPPVESVVSDAPCSSAVAIPTTPANTVTATTSGSPSPLVRVPTAKQRDAASSRPTDQTLLSYRRQSGNRTSSQGQFSSSWRQKNRTAGAVDPATVVSSSLSTPRGDGQEGDDNQDSASMGPIEDSDELTFVLPELTKEGDEVTGKMVRETWPTDHILLLYMLSRYAVCSNTKGVKEAWIRQIPLLVLMYEGITAGALNFDYAPAALVIAQEGKPKRIWMNTTQDGKSAIDDLREANLINGLKLSTKDYHSITAFQVSPRGLQLLDQVTKELRAKVDAFIFAPKPYRRELLKIEYIPISDTPSADQVLPVDIFAPATSTPSWTFHSSDRNVAGQMTSTPAALQQNGIDSAPKEDDDDEFNAEGRFLLKSIGYFRYSEVTETEDVSYVSSPFVPQCVRSVDAFQPLSSNLERAHEAASGQSNIRDTLSEAITLANPVCLIGEWIPFGSNQIVALNERLGSMDRCQGGLFTSLIDNRPTDTQFEVPPGLTEVRILDYDPVRFINFEAEINFPEDDGIVQVENFGIHLNVDGTIFYGIRVDAILDKRADRISIDLLARLLVDIHQDSSEIMDDLLSSYQSSLLDMVFLGDIANRGKYNMIMAEQIDPFMPGLEYMDRGDYENELKQVLGDIHCAYDIGEDSVMIVGRDGMLVAGSAAHRFEKVFIAYFSLLCREMFLRSFFTRIFVLEELLKHIRELIRCAKEDPTHVITIRTKLNLATNDLILFTDTLGYLLESLEFVKIPQKSPSACVEEEEIFSYLDLKKQHHDILLRARDLEKLVHGAKYEVVNLRQMADVLNTSQLEDIFKAVESNTKTLADSTVVVKHTGASLDLIQLMLAGSFALAILDRIPGGGLNVEAPKWVVTTFVDTIIKVPFLFFGLNVLWMALCMYMLSKYKARRLRAREVGRRTLRVKVNKPMDTIRFEAFVATRELAQQESVCQVSTEVRRVLWQDAVDLNGCLCTSGVLANGRGSRREPLTRRQKLMWWWRRKLRGLLPRATTTTGATPVLATNAVAPSGTLQTTATSGMLVGVHSPSAAISPIATTPSPAAVIAAGGMPVQVEVEYDSRHGFLLFVTFHFQCLEDALPKQNNGDTGNANVTSWHRIKAVMRNLCGGSGGLAANESSRKQQANKRRGTDATVHEETQTSGANNGAAAMAMSKPESEILTWFARLLKTHRVITNVEDILSPAK